MMSNLTLNLCVLSIVSCYRNIISAVYFIITFAKGSLCFYFVCLCLSLCLSVCLSTKLLKKLWTDFDEIFVMVNNLFDFGGDPGHDPDSGIF